MIVTLQNDKLTVTVDTLGAQQLSVTSAEGIEYLWYGDPKHWKGRAPHLFPTVGKLRNFKATSAKGELNMPQHGFARTSEFEVEAISDTSVTMLLKASEETLAQYPYRFEFRVIHTLCDNAVSTTYRITNADTEPMPFGIGGHPGFRLPLVEGDCFEDYAIEFEYPETADCPMVDAARGLIMQNDRNRMLTNSNRFPLYHTMFRGDALIFDDIRSRKVRLVSNKSGRGVEMAYPDFPVMAFWTPVQDAPFLCLEPWTSMATGVDEDDVFEHKQNIQTAAVGETKAYTYTVTVF